MARQIITPTLLLGSYPGTVGADAADLPWVACDSVNFEEFASTGKEVVLFRNDNVAAQTVTISSVADPFNRTGDVAAYSLGIGEYAVFGPLQVTGWKQADGNVYSQASANDVFIAVLRLP